MDKNTITLFERKRTAKTAKTIFKLFALALVFAMLMTTVALAADDIRDSDDIWATGNKLFNALTDGIGKICISAGILVGSVSAFLWFTSQNQKTVDMASSWGKRMAIGLILVGCMSAIVHTIGGYVGLK